MASNQFNTFIQTEVPRRPYLINDVDQETVIIRRGNGPRQLAGLKLADGQTLLMTGGQLKAVNAGGLANGMDVTRHEQKEASDQWVIGHNMNCTQVLVNVIDNGGKVFIPSEIERVDENNLKITLPEAITGEAWLVGFNDKPQTA